MGEGGLNKGETKDMIDGFMKWKLQKKIALQITRKAHMEITANKV